MNLPAIPHFKLPTVAFLQVSCQVLQVFHGPCSASLTLEATLCLNQFKLCSFQVSLITQTELSKPVKVQLNCFKSNYIRNLEINHFFCMSGRFFYK